MEGPQETARRSPVALQAMAVIGRCPACGLPLTLHRLSNPSMPSLWGQGLVQLECNRSRCVIAKISCKRPCMCARVRVCGRVDRLTKDRARLLPLRVRESPLPAGTYVASARCASRSTDPPARSSIARLHLACCRRQSTHTLAPSLPLPTHTNTTTYTSTGILLRAFSCDAHVAGSAPCVDGGEEVAPVWREEGIDEAIAVLAACMVSAQRP